MGIRRRLDWLIPHWLENASAYDQSENLDIGEIGLTFALNVIAAFIILIVFGQRRKNLQRQYDYSTRRLQLPKQTPPDLPRRYCFGWMLPCLTISYDDILYYAGLDALMYIRSHYLGMKIFSVFAVYGLLVLVPLNSFGNGGELSLFNIMTLSNISNESPKMWAHVVGIYLLTAITMWQLVIEFRCYTRLRHEFLRRRRAMFRSVLVEEVPTQLRSQVNLRAYFEKLYPNQVREVFLCQHLETLQKLVDRRENVLAKLEHAMFKRQKLNKTVFAWVWARCRVRKVEAVEYYQAALKELNDEVSREQARRLRFARQASKAGLLAATQRMEEMLKRLHFDPGAGDVYTELAEDDAASSYQSIETGNNERENPSLSAGFEEVKSEGMDDSSFKDKAVEMLKKNPFLLIKAGVERGLIALGLLGDIYGPRGSEMMQLLEKHEPADQKFASKAFITFKSFTSATIARQVLHSANPGYMRISEAPEPQDIYWEQIYMNARQKRVRHWVAQGLFIFLCIAYIVPVTLIGEYTSMDFLMTKSTFVYNICTSSSIIASAVELIQPCCLLVLMITIPPLLRGIGYMEGDISESRSNSQILSRYFAFLVLNVLLVVSVAGSVLSSIQEIVDTPVTLFKKLGRGLPKVAGFFTDYIIIKCFTGNTLEISRVTSYFQHLLRKFLWYDLTPRDRRHVFIGLRDFLDPGWFPYGKYIAQDLLVMTINMVYAVLAPLILIPGVLFYCSAVVVYTYQLLYIYVPVFESGGQMFPKVFRRYVFGLFIAQATIVGVFLTKVGYQQCYATLPLFFITYYFKTKMRAMWDPITLSLPLELTEYLDRQPVDPLEDRLQEAEKYVQPPLKAPPLASPEIE